MRSVHFLIAIAVATSACTPKTTCAPVDWPQVGFDDGSVGQGEDARLKKYKQDCGDTITNDQLHGYRIGWQAGISRYCTPEKVQDSSKEIAVCTGEPGFK